MRIRAVILGALVALVVAVPCVVRASTYTVNSTGDADDATPGDNICATTGAVCTLRAAITEATAHAGTDAVIVSAIGTLTLTADLPLVSTTMSITVGATCGDLWTNSAPSWPFVIDANNFKAFQISGAGSTVRGFEIKNVLSGGGSGAVVAISGDSNTVQCNYLHLGGANTHGIETSIGPTDGNSNVIGGPNAGDGNVIAANGISGIYFFGTGNIAKGNFIGVTVNGMSADGNADGITLDGTSVNSVVGGNATSREKNLVSGNNGVGINITSGTTTATVAYNFVGLDRTGAATLCQNPDISDSGTGTTLTSNQACPTGCCVIAGASPGCRAAIEGGLGLVTVSGGECADGSNIGAQTQSGCTAIAGAIGGIFPGACGGDTLSVWHWGQDVLCAAGCGSAPTNSGSRTPTPNLRRRRYQPGPHAPFGRPVPHR